MRFGLRGARLSFGSRSKHFESEHTFPVVEKRSKEPGLGNPNLFMYTFVVEVGPCRERSVLGRVAVSVNNCFADRSVSG